MNASEGEPVDVRDDARGYREIATCWMTNPPRWVTWGWFAVSLWFVVFGVAVILHAEGVVHLDPLAMSADMNGHSSLSAMVESSVWFGWSGFVVALIGHTLYTLDHIRRALKGDA